MGGGGGEKLASAGGYIYNVGRVSAPGEGLCVPVDPSVTYGDSSLYEREPLVGVGTWCLVTDRVSVIGTGGGSKPPPYGC